MNVRSIIYIQTLFRVLTFKVKVEADIKKIKVINKIIVKILFKNNKFNSYYLTA